MKTVLQSSRILNLPTTVSSKIFRYCVSPNLPLHTQSQTAALQQVKVPGLSTPFGPDSPGHVQASFGPQRREGADIRASAKINDLDAH
jgi:hypothetical protein